MGNGGERVDARAVETESAGLSGEGEGAREAGEDYGVPGLEMTTAELFPLNSVPPEHQIACSMLCPLTGS